MAACQQLVPDDERVEVMQQVSERLFDYIDEFAGSMAAEFVIERDRWVTSAAAAREEAVRALIEGHDHVPSAIPDYDLTRAHVGLLLWFDPVRSDADTAELQRAALEVLRYWDCTHTLVVPIGRARLWAWGSRRSLPDRLRVGAHKPDRPDVAMAYGSPGAGLAGFRRTHQEALAAERIHKPAQPEYRWATSYAQVEIAALLTDDLPAAAAFLRRHLGPLAADTAPARDLRRTLLAYLEHGNSPHLAAQRLHVSRNTVNYRIKRVEELLGPYWRERSHPLHTALVVLRDIGDHILWHEPDSDQPAPQP
ncbi:helix-turn-helix domain-containing protein [Klenkia sp. LSe6-5]|uniref:Helix-turn-helix domain-containing protein n=1 Tax=Klenkia sesuvii TaxID=3103137 RepID=A0ABU8DZD7_9ACTN